MGVDDANGLKYICQDKWSNLFLNTLNRKLKTIYGLYHGLRMLTIGLLKTLPHASFSFSFILSLESLLY